MPRPTSFGRDTGLQVRMVVTLFLLGAVYALLVGVWRVSSIGSIAGGITAVVVAFATARHSEYKALVAILFALMLFTHRGNISRLLRRAEKRV